MSAAPRPRAHARSARFAPVATPSTKASTEASKAASGSSALKAGMSASVAGHVVASSARSSVSSSSLSGLQQPLGLGKSIAENEGIERQTKPGRFGIPQSSGPQRPIDDLARRMVRRSRGVEPEVQVEEARVPMGEIAVGGGNVAQIGAPVVARDRQLDGRQRPVGNTAQELVLRAEVMQHRHRVDADAHPELAHGKGDLAVARQHVERRVQDLVSVETPPAARAGFGLACCLP